MQDIGYFLYMQQQEQKQQEQQKVNAEINPDLVEEQTATNEEEERNFYFS